MAVSNQDGGERVPRQCICNGRHVLGIADTRINQGRYGTRKQVGVVTRGAGPWRRIARGNEQHSEMIFQPEAREVTVREPAEDVVAVAEKPGCGSFEQQIVPELGARDDPGKPGLL